MRTIFPMTWSVVVASIQVILWGCSQDTRTAAGDAAARSSPYSPNRTILMLTSRLSSAHRVSDIGQLASKDRDLLIQGFSINELATGLFGRYEELHYFVV